MDSMGRRAIEVVKSLCHSYVLSHNENGADNITSLLCDDTVLIGTGKNEVSINIEEITQSLSGDFYDSRDIKFEIYSESYNYQKVTEDVCIVYGNIYIKECASEENKIIADMDTRFSIVCRQTEKGIKACHIHHSVPNQYQLPGEFYPKSVTEKANQILHDQIIIKNMEIEKANQELRNQEEQYRVVIELSDDMTFYYDVLNDKIHYDKEKFERIYGVSNDISRRYKLLSVAESIIHPDDREKFLEAFYARDEKWYVNINQNTEVQFRIKKNNSEYMWVCSTLIPIRHNGRLIKIIGHIKNIDDQKRREQYFKGMAQTDSLTGVSNRRHINECINKCLEKKPKGVMMLLDIDNFKTVNDTLGHIEGDNVLIEFSNILRKNIFEGDVLGRIGGDEFVMFFQSINSKEEMESKAQRVINEFDDFILSKKKVSNVSCSIGIAVAPRNGVDFETLFSKADLALYGAKNKSKRTYVIYNSLLDE